MGEARSYDLIDLSEHVERGSGVGSPNLGREAHWSGRRPNFSPTRLAWAAVAPLEPPTFDPRALA
jgi:hypothetical protein